eukprot:m.25616 g.25616  ORF g.25616 m.25616 type:complete len:173 (-) comp4252_c0_seq2:139-657(-)
MHRHSLLQRQSLLIQWPVVPVVRALTFVQTGMQLRNHIDTAQVLLTQRLGSVDAVDLKGNAPLHLCSSAAAAVLLLTHGADPLCRNKAKRTPREQVVFVGVSDQTLAPVLAEWEERHGGTPDGARTLNQSLLGWRALLFAAVTAALIVRYLSLAIEHGGVPLTGMGTTAARL